MARCVLDRRLAPIVSSLVLVGLLLAAGTVVVVARRQGGAQTQEPRAPYPAGWWQRHTNPADGYGLALPPEWRVLPLGEAPAADGEEPAARSPLEEQLEGWAQARAADGVGVWVAAASDGALGEATTVNIIRQPLGREMGVEEFAAANVAALRESGSTNGAGNQRWLQVPAGRALRTQATRRLPTEDGDGAELSITQLYLVHGANGYVLTGVTRPKQAEGYAPIMDGIVASLRWLPPDPAAVPAGPGRAHVLRAAPRWW